ncbi:methyltransferase [Alcanivorax sp. MD8A]|uniref:tRNA (guanine(46)-N(7))-methyltransferase TrmB n=1 Tax=Alcanivorax sp. MD8A TaxID=1177157 RepID=UPI000C99F8C3|nr:methyltransferase domain-containing protein [Alcanivorax sp. MD8A]MEE2870418.1 methyltransferase domain-containing protein [Pseudomonadota bacterium]PNE03303.1 methyltransferase [Alcanivorax sp. MD8A]
MFANSRTVTSNQTGQHQDLALTVRKHLDHPWQAPVSSHDRQAFHQLQTWRDENGPGHPLMLDSGCGTGRSSVALALSQPQALVVGVDQSEARLGRALTRFSPLPANLLLLRADCAGLWRLLAEQGIAVARHQILYPNPWPKSAHLKRRWHGHPVWPCLLAMGGVLEYRSNWRVYLEEVVSALAMTGVSSELQALPEQTSPLTDFEEKYQASGQPLWRLTATL